MQSNEDKKWERMRHMLSAAAVGADPKPVVSQRTLFGIKSSVEEQIERMVAQDEARRRFDAASRKAFIFDLDGTLLDTLPDLVNVTNQALCEMGYAGHSTEEIKSYVGNGLKVLLRRAAQGADEEAIKALFVRWQQISSECGMLYTRPFPGVPEMLASLRAAGCRLAVVSNKVDSTTQMVIAHYFPGVFDVVHGEGPDYPRKPDPTGLLKTISEIGATPSASVYVGDSPGDVEVAHAAGTLSAAVVWGYRPVSELRAEHPHVLCASTHDICALGAGAGCDGGAEACDGASGSPAGMEEA